jgi:hypothetical protein
LLIWIIWIDNVFFCIAGKVIRQMLVNFNGKEFGSQEPA